MRFYLERLGGMMTSKRLEHSMGVRDAAMQLAITYGADKEKAALAGLLHDCARDLSASTLREMAGQHKIKVSAVEEYLPVLLHAPVGAVLARLELGVRDMEVLRSIELHTLGNADMTLLDKIVFVADKIEPGRHYPGVDTLRQKALADLDRALIGCIDASIALAIKKGEPVHPNSVDARNHFLLHANNFPGKK